MSGGQYKGPVRSPPPFLFDLDGTLADTIADIAASTNHVRALHGLQPLAVATVQSFVGNGAATLLHLALAELGWQLDDARWHEVRRSYVAHHATECTKTARLYPRVREHLELLRSRGHALGVVTNKPAAFARTLVDHLGLRELLSVVVGGDTLDHRKPDPAPVLFALRQCGHDRGDGTMVGDGETDLRAGRAAGLRTIACLYGYRPEAVLRREGADEYWHRFGGP